MNVTFKEIYSNNDEFIISKGIVLSKFILNEKHYYLIFKQDDIYSNPNLLMVLESNIICNDDNQLPNWIYVDSLISKCVYDGILHFELELKNVYAYKWMIENPNIYAYSMDDLGLAFALIYKYFPKIFKNKKDIDIWNKNNLIK